MITAAVVTGCLSTAPSAAPSMASAAPSIASAAPSTAPATPANTPTASPSTPAATASPADLLPLPDGADEAGVLLKNADGRYDRYRSIGRLDAASSCTATLLDTGGAAADAPAYVVTAAHCLGFLDPNEVMVDSEPSSRWTVAFDWFVDTPHRSAPIAVRSVAYATMGTDLALLELDGRRAQVTSANVVPFRLAASTPAAGLGILNIGAPSSGVGAEAPYLRAGTPSARVPSCGSASGPGGRACAPTARTSTAGPPARR